MQREPNSIASCGSAGAIYLCLGSLCSPACPMRPRTCPKISSSAPGMWEGASRVSAIATIVTAHFLSETSSSATSYSSEFSRRLLSTYICESPSPPGQIPPRLLPWLCAVHLLLVSSCPVLVQAPGL